MKNVCRIILIISLLLLLASIPVSAGAQSFDLSGSWQDDNNALYCIRQSEDNVFWRMVDLPRVNNVFSGTIAGEYLTGEWADLPGGRQGGQGFITLKVESPVKLIKVAQAGNYKATVLTRSTKEACTAIGESSFTSGSSEGGERGTASTGAGESQDSWYLVASGSPELPPKPVPLPPVGSNYKDVGADTSAYDWERGYPIPRSIDQLPIIKITDIEAMLLPLSPDKSSCQDREVEITFTVTNVGSIEGLVSATIHAYVSNVIAGVVEGEYKTLSTEPIIRYPGPSGKAIMKPGGQDKASFTIRLPNVTPFTVRGELYYAQYLQQSRPFKPHDILSEDFDFPLPDIRFDKLFITGDGPTKITEVAAIVYNDGKAETFGGVKVGVHFPFKKFRQDSYSVWVDVPPIAPGGVQLGEEKFGYRRDFFANRYDMENARISMYYICKDWPNSNSQDGDDRNNSIIKSFAKQTGVKEIERP